MTDVFDVAEGIRKYVGLETFLDSLREFVQNDQFDFSLDTLFKCPSMKTRLKSLEKFTADEPELIEFDVEVPLAEQPDGEKRPDSPREETSEGMNAPEVDDESSESEEEDEEKHKEKSLAEVIRGWANKKRRLDMKERMFGEHIERNRKRRKMEEEKRTQGTEPTDGLTCIKGAQNQEDPPPAAPAPDQAAQPLPEQPPEEPPRRHPVLRNFAISLRGFRLAASRNRTRPYSVPPENHPPPVAAVPAVHRQISIPEVNVIPPSRPGSSDEPGRKKREKKEPDSNTLSVVKKRHRRRSRSRRAAADDGAGPSEPGPSSSHSQPPVFRRSRSEGDV